MPTFGKERHLSDLSLQDIELLDVPEVTPEDEQKARLTICDHLQDATVARHALKVLGLLPMSENENERTYMKLTHPQDGTVLVGVEHDTIVTGDGWAGMFVGEKADDTFWRLRKVYGVKVERFDG